MTGRKVTVGVLVTTMLLLLPLFADDKKENGDGRKTQAVIYAKKSDKLTKELNALVKSGGTLVARTKDGGAVVELPDLAAVAAVARLPGVTKVDKTVPKQVEKVERLIVLYKPNDKPSKEKLAKLGFEVIEENEDGKFYVVKPTKPLTADAVASLAADAAIRFVEPDYEVRIPPQPEPKKANQGVKGPAVAGGPGAGSTPNDPDFSKLWGMQNIRAPLAWDKATESEVIVAVIDTGVDYNHEDLKGNMWANLPEKNGAAGQDDDGNGVVDDIYGVDFVNNDGDPMDDNRHGTHCAGTIAAVGNNGKGVVGVNFKARVMAVKFLSAGGSGATSGAIRCIDYARKMKKPSEKMVMSNSWGGGGFSQALFDAIGRAEQAGILFVAAAGNSGTDNDSAPHYPSSYENENIIAVLSIDSNDIKSSFSCFGKTSVDLGAPGGRDVATGRRILSTIPNNSYAELSGTSMATPHVSGAAALLWWLPQNQTATWKDIRDTLYAHGRAVPALSNMCTTGKVLDIGFIGEK